MYGNRRRIIVALDQVDLAAMWSLVDALDPACCRLKIGSIAFTHFGPDLVIQLQRRGFDIFLDLKFHDIPHTVQEAVRAAADLNVWMLTVHAAGGERMLAAAADVLSQYRVKPLMVAVTWLTSLTQQDMSSIGLSPTDVTSLVTRRAQLAVQAGGDGVVCAATDASSVRAVLPKEACIVTPGIRWVQTDDDQQRCSAPAAALEAGADYLVIGRPITQAKDPAAILAGLVQDLLDVSVSS